MGKFVIALDVMGGDNAPNSNIDGAILAINESSELDIILVGNENLIRERLKIHKYNQNQITIHNTTEVIETSENPTTAIREKKNSSMVQGLKLLKESKASAFISAGNTGALLTGATIIIKRIKGIERPALATLIPKANNKHTFMIDVGASMDSKPTYLPKYAIMGKIYMENIQNIENPKIGIINVGAEEEKGDTFTKEAYSLLKETKNINFIGNVEGRDILSHEVDVVVCDGFVGNVMLKVCEGVAKTITDIIKQELKSKLLYSLGAILSANAFKNIKKKLDYKEVGGAPFLGLKSLVIKAHGSSDEYAVKNAINQCHKFIDYDIVNKIETAILSEIPTKK